jgi:hypothetical protein
MDPRRVASVAALLGAAGWLTKVGLVWAGGDSIDAGAEQIAHLAGLICVVVALAAAGYTVVEKAPLWLRLLVTVAAPLLVMMVWQLLDQAIRALYTSDTWLRDELNVLVAAVLALLLGLWGLGRRRPRDPPADRSADPSTDPPPDARHARGRRAAR